MPKYRQQSGIFETQTVKSLLLSWKLWS